MDGCRQEILQGSNLGEQQDPTLCVTSLKAKFSKEQESSSPNPDLPDKNQNVRQKRRFRWPPATDNLSHSDETLKSQDCDPYSDLTDSCFESNEKDKSLSRQSTFDSEESFDAQRLSAVVPEEIQVNRTVKGITSKVPVPCKRASVPDPTRIKNELNVTSNHHVNNSVVLDSSSTSPKDNTVGDNLTINTFTSDAQDFKLEGESKGYSDAETAPDVVSGADAKHVFSDISASSTLKLKPDRLPRIPRRSVDRQNSPPGVLDVKTVASLLPRNRSSAEESALAHIIQLEADRSHLNHILQADEINGFTGEQDSGVFDLSLVHQEDCDSIEGRESLRDLSARNLTPEQQRKFTPRAPSEPAQFSDFVEEQTKATSEDYASSLCIPSCLLIDLPLFPGLELSEQPSVQVWNGTFECDQKHKNSVNEPHCIEHLSKEILPEAVQKDIFPKVSFESHLALDKPNLLGESSEDIEGPYDLITALTDSAEVISDQSNTMGKKSQSPSKGKQASHMIYSREEFAEEYASPKRSKSLDKKGSSKKIKGKGKERKRLLSDPSQGTTDFFISAPVLQTKEETVSSKRHTIGASPTATQEAGTDTRELLRDNELPGGDETKRLQPRTLLAADNESNNNHDHPHKKRLAHSRGGGISPEIVPSKTPLFQQQVTKTSPEVIADTLEERSFSTGPREVDLITGAPLIKPKRLSLTNQLQKQGSADKSDVIVQQNGGSTSALMKGDLCERKTEIAVERQVLLKQAAKSSTPHLGKAVSSTEAGQQNSRPKLQQQLSVDSSSPYTVITRIIDGEEELILGALPLQEMESPRNIDSTPPAPIPPRKPDRQLSAGKKFRHYACIEPVGQPVQVVAPEQKLESSSSKLPSDSQDKNELILKESLDPVSAAVTPCLPEIEDFDTTPVKQTPPLIITSPPFEEDTPTTEESYPDSPHTASPQCIQISLESKRDVQSPTATAPVMELSRTRVDSCTDTASTVSIPPQSPPDLDYHDLLQHRNNRTPSEHSLETFSEPSINICFDGTKEQTVSEQQMVTVSLGMMPEPQTAKMTIINDETQETISTDVNQEQDSAGVEQIKPSPSEVEHASVPLQSTQAVRLRAEVPSVSSRDEDEADGDNEEDEDRGVYDASYRYSDWIYVGNNQELTMMTRQLEEQAAKPQSLRTVAEVNKAPTAATAANGDSVFERSDETRESVTTTASEKEFQKQYQSLAYRRVHRKTSAIDYQRLSLIARERNVTIKKVNNMFGFRIQYSRPVVVTDIDKGGAAEQAGLRVGDMMLKVNSQDVRNSPHSQVVKLAMTGPDPLHLVVGTNVCNTLNLDANKPVMSGYLHKLGGAGMIRTWKKRWFVLKHDNCLYYYKTEEDVEPLGAIVLCNYTVVKARDVGKAFAFKLTKCKARTYYFYTVTEEETSRWAKHITEAAKPQNTSDIWIDISTHNVGLPALSIKNPDCQGFLNKMGAVRKSWKKRFCVLKDACLYYYKDMDAQHALGVAHFHGYSIQETEIGSKKFGLVLKPPSEELRTFYFFADHETDRKRWVAAFASSIGRWIQTNNGEESDEESAEMLI
ncbi:uncharacterized protein LOC117300807 isoform X1 [Asterias rubens]|uniref:uncharacterized protein LOC117300807 isoform X1 n=1 Tax=Asterias rubens TaxID=7604 RepID=UPI0014552FCF|nr:uncharacterized protein LOC117300807 isoform X1 [Asterias rubens]XP_033640521.1 uncharacterized protein LOC117300807 isoform X1 [Asterias rubens]XP_033640522.1 uncharacterized protein LOC117300807 isoform X1 [Asterias rubens]